MMCTHYFFQTMFKRNDNLNWLRRRVAGGRRDDERQPM